MTLQAFREHLHENLFCGLEVRKHATNKFKELVQNPMSQTDCAKLSLKIIDLWDDMFDSDSNEPVELTLFQACVQLHRMLENLFRANSKSVTCKAWSAYTHQGELTALFEQYLAEDKHRASSTESRSLCTAYVIEVHTLLRKAQAKYVQLHAPDAEKQSVSAMSGKKSAGRKRKRKARAAAVRGEAPGTETPAPPSMAAAASDASAGKVLAPPFYKWLQDNGKASLDMLELYRVATGDPEDPSLEKWKRMKQKGNRCPMCTGEHPHGDIYYPYDCPNAAQYNLKPENRPQFDALWQQRKNAWTQYTAQYPKSQYTTNRAQKKHKPARVSAGSTA